MTCIRHFKNSFLQANNQSQGQACQQSDTDLLLCSRIYNDESSLGLSGIKWVLEFIILVLSPFFRYSLQTDLQFFYCLYINLHFSLEYWLQTESLGPFDLGLSSSRKISSADNISIGGVINI